MKIEPDPMQVTIRQVETMTELPLGIVPGVLIEGAWGGEPDGLCAVATWPAARPLDRAEIAFLLRMIADKVDG